ncbi:MAG: aldehyde dehydrogenase family protein, partial [Paracoccaceae bacterium]
YYIGENLSARTDEVAARLDAMTGRDDGTTEVAQAVDQLFTYAAWCDKFDGRVAQVPMRGLSVALREPCGVIGAFCPDTRPLLGLVSLMAPAIAMGNRVVMVASQPMPLAALEFAQVLETSDVPGGVVNILTGDHAELAPHMARHMDVASVWSFSGADLARVIEAGAAQSLKRTWVGGRTDWIKPMPSRDVLDHATEVKTVWVPYGA